MSTQFSTSGVDLPDGILVDALCDLAMMHKEFQPVLGVFRFGVWIYQAIPSSKDDLAQCFPAPEYRDLRAVDVCRVTATVGASSVPKRGTTTSKPTIVTIQVHRKADGLPTITLNQHEEGANQPTAAGEPLASKILAAAHALGLIGPSVSEHLRKSDGAALQALAEQVAHLRDLVNHQARANETVRQDLVKEFDQRRKQVDDELTARRAKLEAEIEARRTAIEAELKTKKDEADAREAEKAAEWTAREQALDERVRSLDLQGEREQRRMLRRDIQAAAKGMFEKPDLSDDAKRNFDRVVTACKWILGGAATFLLLALVGPVAIEYFDEDSNLSTEMLALAWSVRLFAGLALAFSSIYFVRWLSTWSRQVTTNELRSKQFALDIDRASWLVEMALEYEKEGKTLNASLIDSFSRGLFEAERKPSPEQPSNSLLHLIRNAESLKVGAAGAEISLTGRQVQRADAQAAKDHEA